MTIKSILCLFGGSESELNALHAAVGLARTYNARIRFLHISPEPGNYIGLYGEGFVAISTVLDAIEKEQQARLKAAKAHVVAYTTRHHIPLDTPDALPNQPSARFIHATGRVDEIIAREGRLSDIIVVGHGISDPNAVYDTAIVAALFNTGRPLILLPEREVISPPSEYKTVALAWNGSLESARAMYYGMPFLEKAKKLYVLTAQAEDEPYNLEAEFLMLEYLRPHGVEAHFIPVTQGEHSIAEALLIRAKELKLDLLVMGAYGHSRFREMMLGGITSHMLEKADIPLLLSH